MAVLGHAGFAANGAANRAPGMCPDVVKGDRIEPAVRPPIGESRRDDHARVVGRERDRVWTGGTIAVGGGPGPRALYYGEDVLVGRDFVGTLKPQIGERRQQRKGD